VIDFNHSAWYCKLNTILFQLLLGSIYKQRHTWYR